MPRGALAGVARVQYPPGWLGQGADLAADQPAKKTGSRRGPGLVGNVLVGPYLKAASRAPEARRPRHRPCHARHSGAPAAGPAGQDRLGGGISAVRCCRYASSALGVAANHFGWPAVMSRMRGQAAACHCRLNGSTTKPPPAAAIARSSPSLVTLRAVSMEGVSRSRGQMTMFPQFPGKMAPAITKSHDVAELTSCSHQ